MKSFLCQLIVLLWLACPGRAPAQFITATNGDGVTCTLTGYTGTNGVIAIPDHIDGLTVVRIGELAFAGPPPVGFVYLFGPNPIPTLVTIPETVTNIAEDAFYGCYNLTNVALSEGLQSIGAEAFYQCESLRQVVIPETVTNIAEDAFADCEDLTNVTLSQGLQSIGDAAFFDCFSLTSVAIPASVSSIGDSAFLDCDGLTSVAISNGVTGIGGYAFSGCAVSSVTIPASVTSLGIGLFVYCASLTNITVDVSNLDYSSLGGVLFDKAQVTLLDYPAGLAGNYIVPPSVTSIGEVAFYNSSLGGLTFPASVTSIGEYAFFACGSLVSVTMGASVANIGSEAFQDCVSLTNMVLSPGLTAIGEGTFFGCASLRQVVIPEGVADISSNAFAYCDSLTQLTIPDTVSEIDDLAFSACPNLTAVYFAGNAPATNRDVFYETAARVYYLPGTSGWGTAFDGVPASPWFRPAPTILGQGSGLGVGANGFGFTISWATNGPPVVVEARTNLVQGAWSPLATNLLTAGVIRFGDAQWRNYPGRFYRVRSP